jgi:integrase
VDWKEHRLRVRRSHTYGDEVMRTTKQRHRYNIGLPADAMHVLQWHVDTQLRTPEQQASELLFSNGDGGFRSQTVLQKPFAEVASELGLTKRVTPRALRRTFNDLARAAQVQDVVTRSTSGHLTEGMQRHYSTVTGDEQRQALAKVIDLTRLQAGRDRRPGGGQQGGQHAPGGGQHEEKAGSATAETGLFPATSL